MPNPLTPPPLTGIGLLDRWLNLLWRKLTAAGEITWNQLGGGSTPFVPLDTTASEPTRAEGQMFWDSTNQTVAVHLTGPDVTLQIGQENHVLARNSTGVTINNGTVVYVSGATGNKPTIALALADSIDTSEGVIGLATEDIEDNTNGYVTTQGVVNGVDTSSFLEGDTLYLDATTPGGLTKVKPTSPDIIVRIGTVLRVNPSVGTILVNVQIITRNATDVLTARIAGSTYSTVQHLQDIFHSAGHVSGGDITDNLDGSVSVSTGAGLIRATDSSVAGILWFDWPANASVSLTDGQENWVYVDYNAGSPVVVSSITEPTEHNTKLKLASIFRVGTELHINETVRYTVGDHAAQMIRRLQEVSPNAHSTGALLGETGTLNVTVTSGAFWNGLLRFETTAIDTSAGGTFTYYTRDGVGGWTEGSPVSQVNTTQYDDGSGTLQTLTANRYAVAWMYLAVDSDLHALYGQGDYTLAQAQDVQPPAAIPPELETDSFLIGKILVQKSASVFTSVESAFEIVFQSTGITQHNDLGGIQGGTTNEYYHLTAARHTDLTDGGDSALHFHSTDRARANHTGTQLLSTISDVTITAANLNSLDDGVNSTLHFHDSDRARANHTGTQLLSTVSDVTITAANLNSLDDGLNSTLHFHDSDRARANHTGTQLLSTISDVTITAANLNTLDDGVNSTLHFHDSDRARANHTGTQLLSTISDVTITAANLNTLDDGVSSSLHFHDSDRDRSNHTGTQLSTTISDFNEAAQDAVGAALVDSSSVDFTYDDAGNSITAVVIPGGINHEQLSNLNSATYSHLTSGELSSVQANLWSFAARH